MEKSLVFSDSQQNSAEKSELLRNLLKQAANGNTAAFGEIYNIYFEKIYRFIYYRVNNKELAEDLTEDSFIKALRKISSVASWQAFDAWLYQIARNTVIDYYREKRTLVALDEIENILEYESAIVDDLQLEQQQKLLLKYLRQLGKDQQLVLRLKFLEELDNQTIALLLGKTEGAVRVIQHRALQNLQKLINESLGENYGTD